MYRNGAGFIEDKFGSDVFVIWACPAEQLLVELDELVGMVDGDATLKNQHHEQKDQAISWALN
jgi:hypothetical protein